MQNPKVFLSLIFAIQAFLHPNCKIHSQERDELVPLMLPASDYGKVFIEPSESLINALRNEGNFQAVSTADNRYKKLSESIGRMEILISNDQGEGTVFCTGALIGKKPFSTFGITKPFVLTAHHCVNGQFRVVDKRFRLGYESFPTQPGRVYSVAANPERQHKNLDFALFELKGDPLQKFRPLPLIFTPRSLASRESLMLLHHPLGAEKQITLKHCRFLLKNLNLQSGKFLHSCDSLPGSSGGLLFLQKDFSVFGVHNSGSAEQSGKGLSEATLLSAIIQQSHDLENSGPENYGCYPMQEQKFSQLFPNDFKLRNVVLGKTRLSELKAPIRCGKYSKLNGLRPSIFDNFQCQDSAASYLDVSENNSGDLVTRINLRKLPDSYIEAGLCERVFPGRAIQSFKNSGFTVATKEVEGSDFVNFQFTKESLSYSIQFGYRIRGSDVSTVNPFPAISLILNDIEPKTYDLFE